MSESKKAFTADVDVARRTHIGGQALVEGIMMRGKYNWAVAVREPSGTIYTEEHDLASGRKKNKWMYLPIIRGCTAFVESLLLGFKALDIASEHAYDWDEEEEAEEGAEPEAPEATEATEGEEPAEKESSFPALLVAISMVIGVLMGVGLFIALPAAISNLILGEEAMNTMSWNIIDGIIRVVLFVAYIWLISRMKDIKRMFGYHGAEHKTIHCYEHELPLTPANADSFPTLHVRCGTAFMIMVMLIAILVYTVLSAPINGLVDSTGVTEGPLRFVLILCTRIALMPLIAGLSYEITVKWAGKRPENPLVKIILWPGMQMQRLTTNPPDEGMLECAIVAMNMVLAREELEAAKESEKPTGSDEPPSAEQA